VNWAWAWALVDGFAAAGVRHAVISPGTRSAPLTLACLRHPALQCHTLLDERVAAFFALGLAKADGVPALVIGTSGSAPANWHPAVVEADAGRHPLLLLSADRPPNDQDCGANQTVSQERLFGPHLRAYHGLPEAQEARGWLASLAARAASQTLWPLPGPVQINLPFREPLLGDCGAVEALPVCKVTIPQARMDAETAKILAEKISGKPGLIIAGSEPQEAAAIARLAEALDCPILADPLSGLRFGKHDRSRVMTRGDLFLRGWAPKPAWVLRFGTVPVSMTMANWLAASGAEEIVVTGGPNWSDPSRHASWMIPAQGVAEDLTPLVTPAEAGWCDRFRWAEAQALPEVPEAAVHRALLEALPEGALLYLGNSMAVRDFDAFSGSSSKDLTVICNRGANGIDGNLSTFLGAAASGRFAAAAALVGDLTFLHDIGGLAAGQGRQGLICLMDNGGGAIFGHLPQAKLPEFSEGWLMPQAADISAAAAVWGHGYVRGGACDVAACLAHPDLTILHLPIDRTASTEAHRASWAAASQLKEPT